MKYYMDNKFILYLIQIQLIRDINSLSWFYNNTSSMVPQPYPHIIYKGMFPELPNVDRSIRSSTVSTNCSYPIIYNIPCDCDVKVHAPALRGDYKYSPRFGAHKLHTRAATWNDARKTCSEEGAHLAIINSDAEAQVLMDMFKQSGCIKGTNTTYLEYLGIHDLYNEGDWVTIFGDSLYKTGYNNWSNLWGGQPDNYSGRQHCGVLVKNDSLDDYYCDELLPFFCEMSPTKVSICN